MLSIVTPAGDFTLLSTAELRSAVGVAVGVSTYDDTLAAIGNRVANIIARECRVAQSGVARPTLRSETVAETARIEKSVKPLVLARRFVTSITSVVENGVTLASTLYEVDGASGLLWRLDANDNRIGWPVSKLVITYVAGFATVPDEIKAAAAKLAADLYFAVGANPNLKRDRVDGVGEQEFWVAPSGDPAISAEVAELLSPFRCIPV